jgi:hypothetical protein
MTTTPAVYPHVTALISALEGAGIRTGDHVAPKSTDGQLVTQVAVLYMIPGAIVGQSLDAVDIDALIRFRIITVDSTPQGAADLADRVAAVLNGLVLSVADRASYRIRLDAVSGVLRDDDVTPPMFYSSTPYRMLSTSDPEES